MNDKEQWSRRTFLQESLRVGGLAVPAATAVGVWLKSACQGIESEPVANADTSPDLKPIKEWRVIFNDDACNDFGGLTTVEIIRERVDYLSQAGVDVLAWHTCMPDVCMYPSKVGEWIADPSRRVVPTDGRYWNMVDNMRALVQAGHDPIDVLTERCHRHGMPFLGSIRMNDVHHAEGYVSAGSVSEFFISHKDWAIQDANGKFIGGMDYAIPGVREHRLAIMREQLERYDMDGLELDFMRSPPHFAPDVAQESASIMTAFVRDIRRTSDEVARSKSRQRPILGARVPPTLAECRSNGLDVESMTRDGFLDYLCPSHFYKPDYNVPVETFVSATKGSQCRVFPTIQPNVAAQYDKGVVLTLDKYRGLANNYFSFGAHGISTFNVMMGKIGTWHVKRHSGSYEMIKEMHDPAALKTHARGYVYDHEISASRSIVVDRASDVGKRKAVPIRVAEEFSDNKWHRVLRFKPHDLTPQDLLQFDINGTVVTDRMKPDFVFLMGDPPNSGRFELDLSGTSAHFGDNELGVTLLKANPNLKPWSPDYLGHKETIPISPIRITELEIVVSAAGTERGEFGSRYE